MISFRFSFGPKIKDISIGDGAFFSSSVSCFHLRLSEQTNLFMWGDGSIFVLLGQSPAEVALVYTSMLFILITSLRPGQALVISKNST